MRYIFHNVIKYIEKKMSSIIICHDENEIKFF